MAAMYRCAVLLSLLSAAVARNETVARLFAQRARNEKIRVIHGSGGGWPADVDRRMMEPYWAAQDSGGVLLRINTNSGPGELDNATEAIMKKLNLEFETVSGLDGPECVQGARDEELAERITQAAGVWFGGGLPGRAVSCLFGYSAQQFGINTPADQSTPVLEALRNHPLVGGISAGAMMQPSAALIHGNEISYTPGFHESADIMSVGEMMMNNRGSGFIQDSFTVHSHFSERGYQGMLPVALIQRASTGLQFAAGFDEGGVGHYFESTGDLFTVGYPERGTGIVLYSDCSGDTDSQSCRLHFLSDGDVWNARTHEFDMDSEKQPCGRSQPEPPVGSECVFNRALGENQNFRRISKQCAAAPVGSVVQSYHTSQWEQTVGVTFTVLEETQAWCIDGEVVSFVNLGLSQTRTPEVPEGHRAKNCNTDKRVFTGF